MKHYIITIWGGVEISSEGPFASEVERDAAAKAAWKECRAENCDNVFRAEVTEDGALSVGVYIGGELDEPIEHVWSEPVRYAGSIADGPPPGVRHRQAVVYECTACHIVRVEAMTDEQAKTMDDKFNPPKRSIDPGVKSWDGKSLCEGT